MLKKEPVIAHVDNFKSALPFQDLGTEVDDDECRQLTLKLKKFYIGDTNESSNLIPVCLTVIANFA